MRIGVSDSDLVHSVEAQTTDSFAPALDEQWRDMLQHGSRSHEVLFEDATVCIGCRCLNQCPDT